MAENPFQRLQRFLAELKRRKVYRVAATYAVVGFVLIQVADLTFVRLGLPSWTVTFVIVLVAVGFPLSLVLAWAFEVTPEGVRRTPEANPAAKDLPEVGEGLSTGYKILVGLGLVGTAVAGAWYLTGGGGKSPEISERTVAVLPFEALGQEKPGTFTEGMHSDLQTKLSNIARLTVTSSRSVERYRKSGASTAAVARELGVGWIVSGDVQRMGDQIQVNVRLVDPDTDTQAWTDSYRRDLTAENLFAIQAEIAKKIARSLEAELTPQEQERVEREPTEDLEAYRLYVQGRGYLNQRTEEGMRRAMDFFRQAIARDSSFARAWAGAADARALFTVYGYAAGDSLLRTAKKAARRALQLNPELGVAHASMAGIHVPERDGPAVLRGLERAVELKPSYAEGHHWLGFFRMVLGNLEEGLPQVQRAAQLNPMSAVIQESLAEGFLYTDSLGKALDAARRASQLSPNFSAAVGLVGAILSEMGRQQEAIDTLRRALNVTDPSPMLLPYIRSRLAVAHLRSGDTAQARNLLGEIQHGDDPFYAGLVHAELGSRDSALADLQTTDFHYFPALLLRYSPVLDPVREHPGFEELLRELNTAWGLNPDGSLPDSVNVSFGSESDE